MEGDKKRFSEVEPGVRAPAMEPPQTRRGSFFSGARAMSPILIGVLPFATITGVTVVGAGIAPLPAIAMSWIIFAGAAQLAAADLIVRDAPFLIILVTALIINLRFMMYSASLAPHFKEVRNPLKWLSAYLLTDQAYAVSISRFVEGRTTINKPWFYLGCASVLWGTWQIGTIMGVFLGLRVPGSWSLDFAIPVTFLAILMPSIKELSSSAAAVSAGVIAVLALDLPLNIGIILAAVSGVVIGFGVDAWRGGKR
ncbi:MAG: branched-chain amino acid ABC transporter permease [Desulfobacterales bacterium]|nr:branched-chain amino acid ABC transporter permease [Desulfobacterales bacterium]